MELIADLDTELRNVIYRSIIDQLIFLPPHPSRAGFVRNRFMIRSNANNGSRPLAIVEINAQIRREFLTLLAFRDVVAGRDTSQDLVRYGPRSLTNPTYIPDFSIYAEMQVSTMHCSKGESSTEKEKCERCKAHGPLGMPITARYHVGARVEVTFGLELHQWYEFTERSRELITATLNKIFKTNKDLTIETLALAAERVLSLSLQAIRVQPWGDSRRCHTRYFKFIRTINDHGPAFWATPSRDLPILQCPGLER